MAGAGYKLFNTGDVLTAAQVNTYLQEQAVMRFANSTARTTALSGVLAEGMMSYLDDTNSVEVYNGSAWVSVGSTGDITGVTAGTGISGGGTSGDVTITNSMATAIDAKGDLIVGTGADTFSRLAVGGTNGHVLTVDSGEATGMKWAAASSGGLTLINTGGTALSGASTTVSSIPTTYKMLYMVIEDAYANGANGSIKMRFNSDTGNNYLFSLIRNINTTVSALSEGTGTDFLRLETRMGSTNTNTKKAQVQVNFPDYTNTGVKAIHSLGYGHDGTNASNSVVSGIYIGGSAITSITLFSDYDWLGGTVFVYGVN